MASVAMSPAERSSSNSGSSSANSPEVQQTPHIAFFSSQNDRRATNSSDESEKSTNDSAESSEGGRRRRAHYREKDVMEFEGRHTPSLVWICKKSPRSPLPGAVVTPDEKDGCYFSGPANVTSTSRTVPSTQASGSEGNPEVSSGPLLARRPPFVHSETVPDVHNSDASLPHSEKQKHGCRQADLPTHCRQMTHLSNSSDWKCR